MHGKVPTSNTITSMQTESSELLSLSAYLTDSSEPNLFHKILRVKSLKTYNWLLNESSVYHLAICCITVGALERIMFKLMKWQQVDRCEMIGGQAPLIQMANMNHSPAAQAVRHLSHILTARKIGAHQIDLAFLTAGRMVCGP